MPKENKIQNSLPQLLKTLWQEKFFTEGKNLIEIKNEFAERGFHFSNPNLAIALARIVQKGILLRTTGKNGKWKYVQRSPATSLSGQRIELFTRYDFHPWIKEVSFSQFEDGYYKEAIQNALVEVVDQVKIKAGHPQIIKNERSHELDGDDLMNHAFGCVNQTPIIKFNELRDSLD